MNFPTQPDPSSPVVHSDGEQPLQADIDPYFSPTLNLPAGPVGALGGGEPLADFCNPASVESSNLTQEESVVDLIEEIDIRVIQMDEWDLEEPCLPMPIRNAFCSESPEPAIAPTQCENTEHVQASQVTITGSPEVIGQDESGRFIARQNSVMYIDGDDGFDYIDLSDRDIASVTFNPSSLDVVDGATQESFTIHYQNISRALFANGHMIDLA